ncbi:hypothetical protein [Thalassotalea sp. PLHSN55]|uniref:hypothetical protein n=1 Tax=Thalassotalea sp. PLHSN55 TaxID=3435888 RepID=UPI003F875C39
MGVSGQIHDTTLLGSNNNIILPAILWNDARREALYKTIEQRAPKPSNYRQRCHT